MSTTQSIQPPMLWDDDSPRARRSDPITSHAAADSSNLADSQQAVLKALRVHKHLAAFELETVLPMWSPSRIRTALSELVNLGLVQKSDKEPRKTRFGRDAIVWELSRA